MSAASTVAQQLKPGKLLIDGEWREAISGKTFETLNPATEQPLTTVADGQAEDVDAAVAAARRAFESGPWSEMTARERGMIVHRIGELVMENADELAELEVLDNGKPLQEAASGDVPFSAATFFYYAGWADKVHGETIPVDGPYFNYTLREPMGVVGQIIPWNFPLLMAAWKIAPALATGNTVVLKPAEQTPLTALRLGELCLEAGVPPGVVNIVTGFGLTAGAPLAQHEDVDKVAFTGEYITGQEIMKYASGNLKRVSLELGGKSPNIVFADADMEAAVEGAMKAIFFNQGQVCCAGSRLFLEKSVHDQFVDQLATHASSLKVGDPLAADTEMGAQISQEHLDKILSYISIGQEEGAQLATGGQRLGRDGYFVQPTVLTGVSNEMRVAQEEIFGPVVAVIPFSDVDEVMEMANRVIFGLAGAVWTRDVSKAHELARRLRAGTIWVNCYNTFDAASPFGGYKLSGFGRELGKHALELYTQVKSVWVAL
ncbi:MAG: aldehyde dehydrogenase family protein [Armatimonadota bacterium]